MKTREIRLLEDQELLDALEDQKESLFRLRLQAGFGRLEDPTAIGKTRRIVARIMTIVREREIEKELSNG